MEPAAGNWRCVVGGGANDAGHVDNATPTPGCSCSCSARRVLKITHRIDPDACLQIIVLSALLTNPPKPTVDVSTLLVVLLVMCNPSPKYTLDFSSAIFLTNSPTLVAYYLIPPYWLIVVVGEGIPPGWRPPLPLGKGRDPVAPLKAKTNRCLSPHPFMILTAVSGYFTLSPLWLRCHLVLQGLLAISQ